MEKNIVALMKSIFLNSVTKLKPKNLIRENIQYDKNTCILTVFDDKYNLKNKNVHIVGAGKAVLEIATEMELVLGANLSSAIVSVPWKILETYPLPKGSVIECYEGAENNVADAKSMSAAQKIKQFIKTLDSNSFLFVLLTGGGSALLPDPIVPVTLQEKSNLIKHLSLQGVDIKELNIVRKKLSGLKGGKLALLAHPAEVVTLLISDIVGICADMVASGPTFKNDDPPDAALKIVQNYYADLNVLPKSIINVLCKNEEPQDIWSKIKVSNYVLGNNVSLVQHACDECHEHGFDSYHISHIVQGNVVDVAQDYFDLVLTLCLLMTNSIDLKKASDTLKSFSNVPIHSDVVDSLLNIPRESKGVFLVSGGEPVVKVVGSGKGGRSQHLALLFSQISNMNKENHAVLKKFNIYMLCGGTDGMDGPTDAAGAIGCLNFIEEATNQKLDVEDFLKNNDSYNFYSKFKDGSFHLKIGHTNTNVMDLHMIMILPVLCEM